MADAFHGFDALGGGFKSARALTKDILAVAAFKTATKDDSSDDNLWR